MVAVGFLTVLPTLDTGVSSSEEMERAFSLFPLVGLGMGIDLTILGWLASKVASPMLAASILLVFWVSVTGGLHLDGVADTFDALALGRDEGERLKIMKESTIGAFGVLAVVLLLILKMAALATVVQKGGFRVILVAPLAARWAVVFLARVSYPAREGGLGAMAINASTKKTFWVASCIAGAVAVLLWPLCLVNLVWIVPLVKGCSAFWYRRIGGITGDVLGATVEVVETLTLVSGALIW